MFFIILRSTLNLHLPYESIFFLICTCLLDLHLTTSSRSNVADCVLYVWLIYISKICACIGLKPFLLWDQSSLYMLYLSFIF